VFYIARLHTVAAFLLTAQVWKHAARAAGAASYTRDISMSLLFSDRPSPAALQQRPVQHAYQNETWRYKKCSALDADSAAALLTQCLITQLAHYKTTSRAG